MPIRAQAADGTIHEFPDGTSQAVIDRAMRAHAQSSTRRQRTRSPAQIRSTLTPAQNATLQSRQWQSRERVGSVNNPALIRPGTTASSLPRGSYFIDRDGELRSRPVSQDPGRGRNRLAAPVRAIADAGDLAAQGITFGQMPRIQAGLGSLTAIPDAVRAGSLDPIAARFDAEHRAQIGYNDAARARSPIASAVGEMIGGFGSGVAVAGSAGRAAMRAAPGAATAVTNALAPRVGPAGGLARGVARAGVAAAGGAAGGAVYGSGENRAVEGALGGAIGGAIGEPMVRGGAAVIRGAGNVVDRLRGGASASAARVSRRPARAALSRMSPEAVARQEAARRAGADPLTNLDLMTTRGQRLMRGAASASDEGQDIARSYGDSVIASAPERAGRVARMTTGQDVDLNAMREMLAQNVRDVGNAEYPQFEQVQVSMTPDMVQALSSPRGRAAVRQAAGNAAEFGRGDDQAQLNYLARILSGAENEQLGDVATNLPSMSAIAQQTPEFQGAFNALSASAEPMPRAEGPTLIDFIRRNGGIMDRDARFGGGSSGDLVNRLGSSNRVPGLINNQSGIPLEDMAERARQAGFLGAGRMTDADNYLQQSSIGASGDDLLDLIGRSLDDPDTWRYGQNEDHLIAMDQYFQRQQGANDFGGAVSNQSEAAQQAARFAEQEAFRSPAGDWTNDLAAVPPSIQELPTMRASALEDIYRAMRDTTEDLSAQPRNRSLSVAMGQRTGQFDQALQSRVPEIAQARAAYQTAIQERDALQAGLGAMSKGRMLPDLEATYRRLPNAAAQQNFRSGAQAFLEQEARSNPGGVLARLSPQHLTGGDMTIARLNAMEAPGNAMAEAGLIERRRLANSGMIQPLGGSPTHGRGEDAAILGNRPNVPTTIQMMQSRLIDWAVRRSSAMSDAELTEFVRLGVSPADLNMLRELAQFAPDRLDGAVRAVAGSVLGNQLFRDRTNPLPVE